MVTLLSVLLAIGLLSAVALATALTFSAGLFLLARLEPAVVRPEAWPSRRVRRGQPGH
jgi:hypothetical protein